MRQLIDHNRQLVSEAHTIRAMDQDIPAELPPPLPSNLSLQAKKQKKSTRKQALTGAEVSERQQKAMTRAQARAKAVQGVQAAGVGAVVGAGRKGKEAAPRMQTRSQRAVALLQDQQV